MSRAEDLDRQPPFGAEVAEYADPTLREIFVHPYRVLYRATDPDIYVLAVVHGSQNLPRRPPG